MERVEGRQCNYILIFKTIFKKNINSHFNVYASIHSIENKMYLSQGKSKRISQSISKRTQRERSQGCRGPSARADGKGLLLEKKTKQSWKERGTDSNCGQ